MARTTHVDIPNVSGVFPVFEEDNDHETEKVSLTAGIGAFLPGNLSMPETLGFEFEINPGEFCSAVAPQAAGFALSPLDDALGALTSDPKNVLGMFNEIVAGVRQDFDGCEKVAVPTAPAPPAVLPDHIQSVPPADLEKVLQFFRELTSKNRTGFRKGT